MKGKPDKDSKKDHQVENLGKTEVKFPNGSVVVFTEEPPDEKHMLKSAEAFSGSKKEYVVDDEGKKELKTGGLIKESAE